MPYIRNKFIRNILNSISNELLIHLKAQGVRGNLNYFLFRTAKHICYDYKSYADFCSELAEAEAEIRRRLLAPYEDKKIEENGDVE